MGKVIVSAIKTENHPSAIPEEVIRLIDQFREYREAYQSGQYNEAQLRQEFINPLFEALGWDVDNKQGHAEAYKDVIHEDSIKIGGATKAPDYCFRIGGFRDDKIRLRGIDSPEIATPEGRAARAFVEELLTLPDGERTQESSPYREVLITTTKTPDKWDRYLVDLYFEKDGREIYLNRLLLDQGHAVPYKE